MTQSQIYGMGEPDPLDGEIGDVFFDSRSGRSYLRIGPSWQLMNVPDTENVCADGHVVKELTTYYSGLVAGNCDRCDVRITGDFEGTFSDRVALKRQCHEIIAALNTENGRQDVRPQSFLELKQSLEYERDQIEKALAEASVVERMLRTLRS